MSEPSHTFLRMDINRISQAVLSLESAMIGYRFGGACAEEVSELARRLQRLARPAVVEAAPPAKDEEPRRAA